MTAIENFTKLVEIYSTKKESDVIREILSLDLSSRYNVAKYLCCTTNVESILNKVKSYYENNLAR